MARTILLTLGRLPKGLELARNLHQAGHTVLIADPFSWHLSKPSRAVAKSFAVPAPAHDQEAYLEALTVIVRDHDVDLIIPVSEEVMHVSLLAARLPAGVTLLAEPSDAMRALHDKLEFIGLCERYGLDAPTTYSGDDPQAEAFAAETDIVVKARLGCSGAGLHFLDKGQGLPEAFQSDAWVVQQRKRGPEISTLSFCRDGRILGHVVYRGLIMSGTVAVCFERVDDAGAVDAWVSAFVEASGYSGFIAFDFICDETGAPWPLECNPRLTSGVHFMNAGDLATLVTGGALDHPVRMKPQKRFQEGHTALTMAYAHIFTPSKFARMLKAIATSRDVLWSSKDPLVFPLMTPMSWPVLKQVMFQGRTFGEAATSDIAWLPDQAGGPRRTDADAPNRDYEAAAS